MHIEIITTQDLQQFKQELLEEIRKLNASASGEQKWLRSAQVRKKLGISAGTLQTLRINGAIPFTKIGSIFYYKNEAIDKALESKTGKY